MFMVFNERDKTRKDIKGGNLPRSCLLTLMRGATIPQASMHKGMAKFEDLLQSYCVL